MSVRTKDGPARILVIDDDEAICGLIAKYLQHHGHTVDTLHDGLDLETALAAPLDVILLDVNLPFVDGFSLLERVVRERGDISVVMLTANSGVESVVEAMRRGAFDYLSKPIDFQRLSIVIRNATAHTRLQLATDGLRAAIIRDDGGPDLICASQAMSEVISLVERVAASRVPVLIHGEAGAGKEIVARRVHARSKRKEGPFVCIPCSAVPTERLEEELFGANAGENDVSGTPSKMTQARGGTLLLDEVGELSMELQTRLLRVLQQTDIDRSRSERDEPRIIASTSRHLPTEVSRGHFRADLFYRLNVFSINVPPLRDRREDIPALVRYAMARFAAREAKPPLQMGEAALRILADYDWPGNVRELNNVIERAALLSTDGTVDENELPEELREAVKAKAAAEPRSSLYMLDDAGGNTSVRPLQELEREMMVAALRETLGNVSEAARRLGIGRATFYRRAQRYGLTREDGFPG